LGADAKEFKPQRWLEEGGIQEKAVRSGLSSFVDLCGWSEDVFGKGFCVD